jgi:hypothetical protein
MLSFFMVCHICFIFEALCVIFFLNSANVIILECYNLFMLSFDVTFSVIIYLMLSFGVIFYFT